jgi:hypothetical protein
MKKRIYIFINGIMCRPGDSHNWNARAVEWIHEHTGHRGDMVEYFCTIVGRAFFEKTLAEKLAEKISEYVRMGYEVILVGHSNGTALILKALGLLDWPEMVAVHLISAACEEDFEKNGLNFALKNGRVGKVCVWMSGHDSALHVAKCRVGRWLGYGVLGLDGPQNVTEIPDHLTTPELWKPATIIAAPNTYYMAGGRVQVTKWPTRDHSDCFKPYNFNETLRAIANN